MTFKNGTVLEKHVKHAIGSTESPLDFDALREKFENQCAGILGAGLESGSKALWDIERVSDIREIARLI